MYIHKSVLEIQGAELGKSNPLPRFRDVSHDQRIGNDGTFTERELEGLGRHTGFRVLPYCVQDRFSQEKTLHQYETIVMENECLRAEFLPQYGGRLYSLYDKKRRKELLFKNPVFQPANLAIRNAWFSGGVEWNVGQLGHAVHTCDDVFFARCTNKDGEEFLRMYDYVRTTGLFWQIDFHLPKDSGFLYAHVKISNDTEKSKPLYWWTNTAVREKGVRIFSGTEDVIYIHPESLTQEGGTHCYGHGKMPCLPFMPGVDVSYPLNFKYTSEYFFQNEEGQQAPWEAAAYPDGYAFLERSTQPLRIRKMFCWGSHSGGRNWLDRLSRPGEGDYVEIQAGLSPTQIHGADIQEHSRIEFTQAFGSVEANTEEVFQKDWHKACKIVERQADDALDSKTLMTWNEKFSLDAMEPCGQLLHTGHGWAALERKRRQLAGEAEIPVQLDFPMDTLGDEEERWNLLLDGKAVPDIGKAELPVSWITDEKWRGILETGLEKNPENIGLHVDLGVLEYENENYEKAVSLWEKSMKLRPTVIACRCLAYACQRKGETDRAAALMREAFSMEKGSPSLYIVQELFSILKDSEAYEQLWEIYESLPQKLAEDERIMILTATAAVELGKDEFLEEVYKHSYIVIREGENQLCDIWFRHQAYKLKRAGDARDVDEIIKEVSRQCTPPQTIDYRLT